MKKTYKIVLVFFLLLNLVAFAQGPSDENNTGSSSLEGSDPTAIVGPGDENNNGGTSLEGGDPAAPISNNLWVLIVMGLLYSYFQMNKNCQMKKLE